MLESILQDVRYALRFLRRSPAFALVAVLSLGVGIGFNAALFSVVDALLLRPLPAAAPEELVDIYTSGSDGAPYATSSYPDYLDFQADGELFQGMAGHSAMFAGQNLGDRSRLVLGEVVTGNYFELLGIACGHRAGRFGPRTIGREPSPCSWSRTAIGSARWPATPPSSAARSGSRPSVHDRGGGPRRLQRDAAHARGRDLGVRPPTSRRSSRRASRTTCPRPPGRRGSSAAASAGCS